MEETFFQLNKEELSLRATMDLVGPSCQALHVQSSFNDSRLLTTPHRAQRGDGRRLGPGRERLVYGKTRQWSRRRRGVGNLTGSDVGWAYTRQRITGGAEWRDGLAVGGVAFR